MFTVVALFLVACSSDVYQEHKDEALEAIKEERYEDAKEALEAAYDENGEEEDLVIINDVESMIWFLHALDEGKLVDARTYVTAIQESQSESEETSLLKEQASSKMEELEKLEQTYLELEELLAEVSGLYEEENYEEAMEKIEAYEIPEEPHGSLADLLVQLEEWKGRIEEAIEIRENEAAEEAAEEEVEEEVEVEEPAEEAEGNTDNTNSGNSSQDTAGGGANSDSDTSDGSFNKEEAAELVAEFAGVGDNSSYQVQFDHENDARQWVFQVFEIVITDANTNEGHQTTWGWYSVDPNTKNVVDLMD
ncbi:hypothetical protein AB990_05530 [Alkalihalobacillus pseudalcaliphilus]|nr:hypothetical protein AB990_05530 [Alkalihalobacillus pseudalcaliphilus]